jgi:hypothetical protein
MVLCLGSLEVISMMNKNIHIVFPKGYKDVLLSEMHKKEYNVVNFDYSLETFHHWSLSQEETVADAVLMAVTLSGNIPIEDKIHDFIEKLTDIRIARPSLRLIIFLPTEYRHITVFKEQMVKLGVYDFYFFDSFSFVHLLEWLEKPKTLADIKEYIQIDSAPKEYITEKVKDEHIQPVEPPETKEKPVKIEAKYVNVIEEEPKTRVERSQQHKSVKTIIEKQIIERVVTVSQKSIAFHSISRGAGSTFHSLNLGAYYSQKDIEVGIYENPCYYEGRTFQADALSLFKMNADINFSAPHHVLKRLPVFQEQIISANNINFYSIDQDQEKIEQFKYEDYVRYLNIGKENIKIMDFGYVPFSMYEEGWFCSILSSYDLHVVCIDLLPTALIPNSNRLKWFVNNKDRMNILFLVNPMPRKFTKNDLLDFGLDDALRCDLLDRNKIFNSLYQNALPFDYDSDIKVDLSAIYDQMNNRVGFEIGEYRSKKGIFSWVSKKKKKISD